MKQYDPLYIDDFGSHSYGMMEQSEDGDYVKHDDYVLRHKEQLSELQTVIFNITSKHCMCGRDLCEACEINQDLQAHLLSEFKP